jgi:hypothetical protein
MIGRGGWRTTRVTVDDVLIRFVDNTYNVTVVAEGDLESSKQTVLIDDLVCKLSSIENSKCVITRIR